MLGFAAGVMITASVCSLIIPGLERSTELDVPEWLPVTVGFLLAFDKLLPHLHRDERRRGPAYHLAAHDTAAWCS